MSQIKQQILQIAESDPTYQQAVDQMEQALSGMNLMPDDLTQAIQMLEFVLQNPDQYPAVRDAAIKDGLIPENLVPPQYDQVFVVSLLVAMYGLQDRLGSRNTQNFARGGLARAVETVRSAGRGGDTELAHINPREAAMLKAMGGSGPINPNTGIREYKSKFGKILGAVAPIALSIIAPGVGTAIGTALGATGAGASALGGALIGGASAGLTGGDVLKGAAFGGLGGGLGSMVGGAASSALGLGLGETGQAILGSGLIGGGLGALTGENPLKSAALGAVGGAAGALGGQAGLGEAFTQGTKAFGNSISVGNDLKTSALSGGLAGLSSALLTPGQAAADQYKAGQDSSMYGKGAVETTGLSPLDQSNDMIPASYKGLIGPSSQPLPDRIQYSDAIANDAAGNTIGGSASNWVNPDAGQAPAAGAGGLGNLVKYAPIALAAGSLLGGAPEEAKQAVSQLSPSQQEYFNRPSVQWDWGKLQSEAQQSGMPLNQYIAQRWDKVSSGAYNAPVVKMAQGGLASVAGMSAKSGGATKPSRFVQGPGSGRDDEIPAKVSAGEYIWDAEAVALAGDGSSEEGARRLDTLREDLRKHKGKALAKGKISPDAKPLIKYMKGK